MKILRYSNNEYMAVLGLQPVNDNEDYTMAKHCLVLDVDGGKVILNSLTRAIVYLDANETEKNIFMYRNYFLVPESFDSIKVIDDLRRRCRIPLDSLYLKDPNQFTILNTTDCNARCFYCYEGKLKNKHHMTPEVALKVAKYIEQTNTSSVDIDWFGGEPLYNVKAIDLITNYLISKNKKFQCDMITNGYLFNEHLIKKAKEVWNLTSVQITIDGTEKIYNKVKNYKNPIGSNPFKRVMDNIELLLLNNIFVYIRINVDNYNSSNIFELIKVIAERFGVHPSLRLYLWPIFEEGDYQRTTEQNTKLFNSIKELEKVIIGYGFGYGTAPKETIMSTQCMADCGTHVTIDPDGNIGLCEHFVDSDFHSSIHNPDIKDYNILESWREYEKPLDICQDCPIYGSCLRLSKCVEMRKCNQEIKEWKIRKALYGLSDFYNNYLNENV